MDKVAGRLELLMELYDKGLLCHCSNTVQEISEDGDTSTTITLHEDNCPGKLKLAELMGYEDGKV